MLFYAVKEQNIKSVALLLEKNANMYTIDGAKIYTAFSLACLSNPLKLHENKIELVKLFLNNNVDVNYQYNKSVTALTQATKGCHNLQLVKLLLDKGANPDISDKYGFTTRNGLFRHCIDKKKYKKMMELINEY